LITVHSRRFHEVQVGIGFAVQPDRSNRMSNDALPIHDPHAALENMLIDEFLALGGHSRHSVSDLTALGAGSLLAAASLYASLRLADIEAKAHYADEIHRSS
jgi:hypothetical protein